MTKIASQYIKSVPVMRNQYGRFQKKYNDFLTSTGQTVSPESVRKYLERYKDMSASTQRLAKTSIKQALEASTINPVSLLMIQREFKKIRTKKADKKVLSYLTQKQIIFIKSQATQRVALLIESLEQTGLRISELLSIKLKDIDCAGKENCQVQITGKGLKIRTVYFTKNTIDQLKKEFRGKTYLIETKQSKKYSRITVQQLFKRVSEKTNIRFSPHSFRHSYASRQIIENDKTVKSVSNHLGHSTTAITLDMYCHDSLTPQEAVLI